jgi:hypothetical protein
MKNLTDLPVRIGKVFGACSDEIIEQSLLPLIYLFTKQRLGESRAQKLFNRLGSKSYASETDARLLILGYLIDGQRNKEAFLRRRVAYNKTLPRSEQRGAGGTDVDALRTYLNTALRNNSDFLARPEIAMLVNGGPDFAEKISAVMLEDISEKTS